jgi:hypothetical protein
MGAGMSAHFREPVGCWCGWRGRRVFRDCDCDTPCYCRRYGACPKCKSRVLPMRWLKADRAALKGSL